MDVTLLLHYPQELNLWCMNIVFWWWGGGGGGDKNLMNTNGNEESMGRGGDLYRLATYDGLAMTHALF